MRDQAEEAVERAGSRFGTVNAIARILIGQYQGAQGELVSNIHLKQGAAVTRFNGSNS